MDGGDEGGDFSVRLLFQQPAHDAQICQRGISAMSGKTVIRLVGRWYR